MPHRNSKPLVDKSVTRAAKVEEKRLKALALRVSGQDYVTIGKTLGWTPIEAKAEIDLALGMYRMERLEGERSVVAQRYDALIAAWWPQATAGDKDAAEIVLKTENQRAKLLGLNVPERHELTGAGGTPLVGAIPTAQQARDLVREFFGENALPPPKPEPTG